MQNSRHHRVAGVQVGHVIEHEVFSPITADQPINDRCGDLRWELLTGWAIQWQGKVTSVAANWQRD